VKTRFPPTDSSCTFNNATHTTSLWRSRGSQHISRRARAVTRTLSVRFTACTECGPVDPNARENQ
jgi:hypothetical protein